jgi:hypothetical protein
LFGAVKLALLGNASRSFLPLSNLYLRGFERS